MCETETTTAASYWQRLRQALPWFLTGTAAFCVIGFGGAHYQQQRANWPLHQAQVLNTQIRWAPHMSDQYELTVNLQVHPNGSSPYFASLLQAGPKGSLEKRVQRDFAQGNWLSVRGDPNHPGQVILKANIWGAWLIGGIVGLFFIGNGFTVMNRPSNHSSKQNQP